MDDLNLKNNTGKMYTRRFDPSQLHQSTECCPLEMPATETGEMLGRTTFRTWPKSPKNPQQLLDPGRESLREYIWTCCQEEIYSSILYFATWHSSTYRFWDLIPNRESIYSVLQFWLPLNYSPFLETFSCFIPSTCFWLNSNPNFQVWKMFKK